MTLRGNRTAPVEKINPSFKKKGKKRHEKHMVVVGFILEQSDCWGKGQTEKKRKVRESSKLIQINFEIVSGNK